MPISGVASCSARSSSLAVMHFDEHRHAEAVGDGSKSRMRRQIECRKRSAGWRRRPWRALRGPDRRRPGSPCAGRQIAGGTRCLQVRRRALEKLTIGQHRQTCRAMPLITGGDLGRAKVGAQDASRRAGLLDLGDHRRLARRRFASRIAPRKSRAAGCRSASARSATSGTWALAATTSARLTASMRLRMSLLIAESAPLLPGASHGCLRAVRQPPGGVPGRPTRRCRPDHNRREPSGSWRRGGRPLDALRLQVDQNILLQALELAIGGKLGATIESRGRFGEDFGDQQRIADVVWCLAVARIASDHYIGIEETVGGFNAYFDGLDEDPARDCP
jgi:hypothetical protein